MVQNLLSNRMARRLFLDRHCLCEITPGPSKPDALLALIQRLGFVQIDSINTIARAHHMIIRSRYPAYRVGDLDQLLEHDHSLFEHWTHDAAIIPTSFYPHWHFKFQRDDQNLRRKWKMWQGVEFEKNFNSVLDQIHKNGPVCSSDVGKNEPKSKGGWWDWHPSKTALEYLWRTGKLAVSKRIGFQKYYDLSDRVIPDGVNVAIDHLPTTIDWHCAQALDRLGFATPKEIAAFWDTLTLSEVKNWCALGISRGELIEIDVENHDNTRRLSYARPDVFDRAQKIPSPPDRVRILSPFDPALRDRDRAERLFGFHYRIEIFVPAAKRQYGYYVFPVLQGDRLIGRIDAKADRKTAILTVTAFWVEQGVNATKSRLKKLDSELGRVAQFSNCERVEYCNDWLRLP